MYQSGPNWNESTKIDQNTMLIWLNKASAFIYYTYILDFVYTFGTNLSISEN